MINEIMNCRTKNIANLTTKKHEKIDKSSLSLPSLSQRSVTDPNEKDRTLA